MFCPYCGNTIDKLTRHCPSCGASLEDEKEALEPSPAQSVSVETFTSAGKPQKPAQTATTKTADRQATVASNSQTLDEPKKKMSFPMRLLIIVLSSLIGSAMAQSCARRTIEAEASRVNSSNTSRTSTYTSEADDADAKAEEPEEKDKEESEQAAQDAETTTTATEDNGKTTESKNDTGTHVDQDDSDDTESDPADARQITHVDIDTENVRELDLRDMMIASGYDSEFEFEGLVFHLTPSWFEYGLNDNGTQMKYRTYTNDCSLTARTIENQGATSEDLIEVLTLLLAIMETQNEQFEIVEEPHFIDASEDGYQAAQMLIRVTKSNGTDVPTTHFVEQILTDDGRVYSVETICLTGDEDKHLDTLRAILSILEVKQSES